MKICITAKDPSAEGHIDPRFGRCRHLCTYDSDTKEFSFEENRFAEASGGVGVRMASYVVDSGAQAVLTGQVGPNAARILRNGNVAIHEGATGSVAEAVSRFFEQNP